MGRRDGRVIGASKILNNGSNSDRFNIVILAEGFTASQQDRFNDKCEQFLNSLRNRDPLFRHLLPAINVHRINVASNEEGVDDPDQCEGGTGTSPRTFFDASLCGNRFIPFFRPFRRAMSCNTWLVYQVCDENVPEWDVALLLVNSEVHGGTGFSKCAISTLAGGTHPSYNWTDTARHELGHSVFGLADEYAYMRNCDKRERLWERPASSFEPFKPNITRAHFVRSKEDVKWGHLIKPEIPIPTQNNPDCTQCPEESNPLSSDKEIGLFEGAGNFRCDLFRPAYTCLMREKTRFFCYVCIEAIHDVLRPFLPTAQCRR